MENDFDEFDDGFETPVIENDTDTLPLNTEDSSQSEKDNNVISDSDFINELLKHNGISDRNKILYENEEGEEVEMSWDNLPTEDKLNILRPTQTSSEDDLDDSEIELINTIRSSKMSPAEYIQYIEQNGVNRYLQNSQVPHYKIDDYSDDDLFMLDLIARLGDNITDDEVRDALEQAKSNQTLFTKLMESMRNQYRQAEQDEINQAEFERKQDAEEQYNQFSQSIIKSINNFTDFNGCEINMDKDEMEELYEFITGFDDAGNNHFAKVLNDPKLVVKMAWTLLNGELMINDINEYYKSEISKVRKTSYEKGLADANKKSESTFIIKNNDNIQSSNKYIDDDEF